MKTTSVLILSAGPSAFANSKPKRDIRCFKKDDLVPPTNKTHKLSFLQKAKQSVTEPPFVKLMPGAGCASSQGGMSSELYCFWLNILVV